MAQTPDQTSVSGVITAQQRKLLVDKGSKKIEGLSSPIL